MDYTKEIRKYLDTEREVLAALEEKEISDVMNVLEEARLQGKRVFVCGNGGSASTASHFCVDFNKGASEGKEKRHDFECLSDNIPTLTAIANDICYEDVFVELLKNKLHQGDVVIGISGSGNSMNVVKAMEYANEKGAVTVGLVGYDGGKVKQLVKHSIHVRIDNMQIVEDVHLAMDHVMMFVLGR